MAIDTEWGFSSTLVLMADDKPNLKHVNKITIVNIFVVDFILKSDAKRQICQVLEPDDFLRLVLTLIL